MDATRRLVAAVALVIAPIAVTSLYLVFSRWPQRSFTVTSDYVALGIAVVVGAAALPVVVRGHWQRIVAMAVYLPVAFAVVTVYSFFFVCIFFGDCP